MIYGNTLMSSLRNETIPGNYRSIALQSTTSNVMKKAINMDVIKNLDNYRQYCFRQRGCTGDLLSHVCQSTENHKLWLWIYQRRSFECSIKASWRIYLFTDHQLFNRKLYVLTLNSCCNISSNTHLVNACFVANSLSFAPKRFLES